MADTLFLLASFALFFFFKFILHWTNMKRCTYFSTLWQFESLERPVVERNPPVPTSKNGQMKDSVEFGHDCFLGYCVTSLKIFWSRSHGMEVWIKDANRISFAENDVGKCTMSLSVGAVGNFNNGWSAGLTARVFEVTLSMRFRSGLSIANGFDINLQECQNPRNSGT